MSDTAPKGNPWVLPKYERRLTKDDFVVAAQVARQNFSKMISSARSDDQRIVITSHNVPTAAVMTMKDFYFVRALEKCSGAEKVADLLERNASNPMDAAEFKTALIEALSSSPAE